MSLQVNSEASNAPASSVTRAPAPNAQGSRRKTLLILSQTFVPDPASVGQHVADVAIELARRGNNVRVYASDRGYENPKVRYARRENLHGVDVRRLAFTSFGKKSIFTRIIGTWMFHVRALLIALFTPRLGGIVFSTSPPMVGLAAAVVRIIRRVPTAYWAMDLNPDQLWALNKIEKTSVTSRILEAGNRFILRNSDVIIALDRFMADRLKSRPGLSNRLVIIPPWPHETHVEALPHDQNPFRAEHGLTGKFVIMYSGNHSPSNPLQTVLDAALQLRDDPTIRFMFIGGGTGKKAVEQFVKANDLGNCICLPYQPLETLRFSLSAADAHVVSLGDDMIGIIHPCKVYGAMAVARPVLFVGPRPSHVSDLLDAHAFGLHVSHGDVDGAVQAVRRLASMSTDQLHAMGQTAQRVLHESLSQAILCGRFCDEVEKALRVPTSQTV